MMTAIRSADPTRPACCRKVEKSSPPTRVAPRARCPKATGWEIKVEMKDWPSATLRGLSSTLKSISSPLMNIR